jgi:YHS domain-containing protein
MLVRFVIIIILLYVLYRIIKLFSTTRSVKNSDHQYKSPSIGGEDLVEDPFCHTYIPVSQACKKEIAGKVCYFCSKECCESYILVRNKERQ